MVTQAVLDREGLGTELVVTDIFEHRVFYTQTPVKELLHVYIDGDGTPWIRGVTPAKDPTPRNPMVLRMMARDDDAAVYLGRPCYHDTGPAHLCGADTWTSGRYSQSVIDSMEKALIALADKHGNPEIILIGYSGGGVIAAALAQRLTLVTGLLTVASNLDTRLWTESLGLLPLTESINPVELETSRPELKQRHLAGGKDTVVPMAVSQSYVDRHGGELVVYPDFDHRCCWEDAWEEILELADELRANPGGPGQ